MTTALSRNNKSLILLLTAYAAVLVLPNKASAAAGGNQICDPNETCEIGEFLYDDDSTPITSATCTISSKNPSGTAYLSDAALTANSDGWYSYKFTAPTTEGLYRTEICCTYNSDNLCIDKSFEVKSASSSPSTSDIAAAVWGYSDRTVTSLGTLVRDIWLHSNRTFTSLNITSSTSSSTNSTGDLGDLAEIKKVTKENRLLLEELVNKPIIENYLEEESFDIGVKLDETRSSTNGLFANSQYLRSKTELVLSRWNSFSEDELLDTLVDLDAILGNETDTNNIESIYGDIKYLGKAWDWKELESLTFEVGVVNNLLDSTKVTVSTYGKSSLAYKNMKSLIAHYDNIDRYVGDSSDKVTDQTLYGRIQEVSQLAKLYSDQKTDVDSLINSWNPDDKSKVTSTLNQLASRVVPINRLPQLNKFLSPVTNSPEDKELKNKAFGIRGVLDTNIKLLASPAGTSVSNTWLELGSIVFKSVVTNPSTLISQVVPLKYYLPPEVREEHIIKTDDSLKVNYDAERDQYYVSGEFTLEPGETITLSVHVEDIFAISESQVDSLRRQAEDLARPLEKTAFFAQSVTLISDINVSLDKILALQAQGVTPEAKIRAYREALIEMDAALNKIDKLKELVSQASSSRTLIGFVGGVQAIAVWGLIIIMAAGFIFLALYLKVLKNHEEKPASKVKAKKDSKDQPANGHSKHNNNSGSRFPGSFRPLFPFIIFGAVVSLSTGAATYLVVTNNYKSSTAPVLSDQNPDSQAVLSAQDSENVAKDGGDSLEKEQEAIGGPNIVRIEVPAQSKVNIRSNPDLSGAIIYQVQSTLEVIKLEDQADWVKIALKSNQSSEQMLEGWVSRDFIFEPVVDSSSSNSSTSQDKTSQLILIDDTPTGWLKVRTAPGGGEIARVIPGDTYELIGELDNWYKIKFADNSEGFVSKTYSHLASAN